MFNKKDKKTKKRKGFTLIELMIVIAILGLLIAMLVPSLVGYRNTALTTTTNAEASSIKTAISAYEINTGAAFAVGTSDLTEYLDGVDVQGTAGDDIWGLSHADYEYTLEAPTNLPQPVIDSIGTDPTTAPGVYKFASLYKATTTTP